MGQHTQALDLRGSEAVEVSREPPIVKLQGGKRLALHVEFLPLRATAAC